MLPEVARLRIAVFRAWPYLYEGTPEYEADYLQVYLGSPDSLMVLVYDQERLVGASTALPLAETEALRKPFPNPEDYCYFGESVLLPEYRGQGYGARFFVEREAHARKLGRFRFTCFAAVERPADHPLHPPDYRPLDDFWRKRGYLRHPELSTSYSWQDVDRDRKTDKPMVFWLKTL